MGRKMMGNKRDKYWTIIRQQWTNVRKIGFLAKRGMKMDSKTLKTVEK